MEIKVREIASIEPKGIQEMENLLLRKHEEEINNAEPINIETSADPIETINDNSEPPVASELKEEDVLSYIGKRFNKDINSFDELMQERNQESLPEDVSAFLKFKKETGRDIKDFLKVNENIDSLSEDEIIKRYLKSNNSHLDDDDVDTMMDDYRFDEDIDDDSDIKKIRLARKKIIVEAKSYLNQEKEKYRMPLESRQASISDSDKEEIDGYKQSIAKAKSFEEEQYRRKEWFDKQTENLFNEEFKGFEFNIDDKKIRFSTGDLTETKKQHINPSGFINKFLDENGLLKDTVGYHKALAVALNPEKFAKFFYEQGKSDATDDVTRKIKNINMSERIAPQATIKEGVQVKEVNPDSGRNLKIRSFKNR
jgi:hypothetical protein